MKRLQYCCLSTLLFALLQTSPAQTNNANENNVELGKSDTDSKKDDIKRLISAMGTEESLKLLFPQLLNQMKQAMPQVPERYWRECQTNLDFKEIIDIYIPIYDKYFTHEEINELTKYYESPLGKKFVATMPRATQEAMARMSAWGKELGERIRKQMQQDQRTTSAAPKRLSSTDPAYKAYLLKKGGFDPDKYDLSDYGDVSVKAPTEVIATPKDVSQPVQPFPLDVRYMIIVKQPNGESEAYWSEKEPKSYGNGFKFLAYPDNTEMIVSGSVTVRKLDSK